MVEFSFQSFLDFHRTCDPASKFPLFSTYQLSWGPSSSTCISPFDVYKQLTATGPSRLAFGWVLHMLSSPVQLQFIFTLSWFGTYQVRVLSLNLRNPLKLKQVKWIIFSSLLLHKAFNTCSSTMINHCQIAFSYLWYTLDITSHAIFHSSSRFP